MQKILNLLAIFTFCVNICALEPDWNVEQNENYLTYYAPSSHEQSSINNLITEFCKINKNEKLFFYRFVKITNHTLKKIYSSLILNDHQMLKHSVQELVMSMLLLDLSKDQKLNSMTNILTIQRMYEEIISPIKHNLTEDLENMDLQINLLKNMLVLNNYILSRLKCYLEFDKSQPKMLKSKL